MHCLANLSLISQKKKDGGGKRQTLHNEIQQLHLHSQVKLIVSSLLIVWTSNTRNKIAF